MNNDLFSSSSNNNGSPNYNLQLITGSFDEDEKIRRVVKDATYVVCLLNDCGDNDPHQQENLRPPTGNIDNNNNDTADNDDNSSSYSLNLNFMHNLVPILEESDTCRVLLYQVSI